MLAVVGAAAQAQLSGPTATLVPDHFAEADGWAFVTAALRAEDGGAYPLERSSLAQRAQAGEAEARLSALAGRDASGVWRVVSLDLGSTDVPWLTWPDRYAAPAAIFPATSAYEVPAWD